VIPVGVGLLLAGCGGGSSSTSTSSLTTVKQPQTERQARSSPATKTKPQQSRAPTPSKPASRALPPTASPNQTVRVALTSTDPAVCELYTPKLLDKSFGGIQGCRSSIRSGGRADSVEIVSSNVKKKEALVVAVPHGGPSSAEKLRVTLVRSGKPWQLQSIKSNVPVGP
jgi:hypothetical protein